MPMVVMVRSLGNSCTVTEILTALALLILHSLSAAVIGDVNESKVP